MSNRDAADHVILDAEEAIQYWECRKPTPLFDGFTGLVRICDSERWEEPGLIRARAFHTAPAPKDSNVSGDTGSGGASGVGNNVNAVHNPAITKAVPAAAVQPSLQQSSNEYGGHAVVVSNVQPSNTQPQYIQAASHIPAVSDTTSIVPDTHTAAAQSTITVPATEATTTQNIPVVPNIHTTGAHSTTAVPSTQAVAAQELGVDLADLMSLEAETSIEGGTAGITDTSDWLQDYLSAGNVGYQGQQPVNAFAQESVHSTGQPSHALKSTGGDQRQPVSSKQALGGTGQPIMSSAVLKKAILTTAVRAAKLEVHNQMDWVDDLPSAPTQTVKLPPKPPSNP